jgi:predicted DNA-binding transcriptional regulator AlpA
MSTSTRQRATSPRKTTPARIPAIRRELLSLNQVLAELGDENGPLARSTFYDWRAKRVAPPCFKLPNGELRIRRAEFDAWLDALPKDAA